MASQVAMRADAARNRERIVGAARVLFAEAGVEGCVSEVARRAHVGNATVFRHFPTKDDLVGEALLLAFGEVVELARNAAESHTDASAALEALMLQVIGAQRDNRCSCAPIPEAYEQEMMALRVELLEVVQGVLARGITQQTLRAGITAQDIAVAAISLSNPSMCDAVGDWRRVVKLIVQGARP